MQKLRTDGYHDILTYMRCIDLCDILEIIPSDNYSMSYSGHNIESDEMIDQMARWLIEKEWLSPVQVHLHKIIPLSAGLGGGSSDLATFTKYAVQHRDFKGQKDVVLKKMQELSTDADFFYKAESAVVSGKGDVINSHIVDLSGYYLLLIIPSFKVKTSHAYESIDVKETDETTFRIILQKPERWSDELTNDFEVGYIEAFPEFQKWKSELYEKGALYVSLTGSGSAFYAIFKECMPLQLDDSMELVWLSL